MKNLGRGTLTLRIWVCFEEDVDYVRVTQYGGLL
jgi:hypothetical protein